MKRRILLFTLIASLLSCARSGNVREEYEYTDSPPTSFYRNEDIRAPVEKVESMGQPKKKVVVFNFWNNTPVIDRGMGQFVADQLRKHLFLTRRLVLPTDVRLQLETSKFIDGDHVKVAQLVRESRELGISVLVLGRIKQIVFRQRGDEVGVFRQKQSMAAVDLEIKVFDITSGREISAANAGGEATSDKVVAFDDSSLEGQKYRAELTRVALKRAAAKLTPYVLLAVEKMTWQGAIAKISGKKVYVNAGRKSGLVSGDILKVLTPGDEVYDPTTGAFLGNTEGQLKGTLEIKDFIGEDASVATMHTGGNFQEGDLVRLY